MGLHNDVEAGAKRGEGDGSVDDAERRCGAVVECGKK